MARPCESRNDLLNRWVRMKREERKPKSWEKPSDPRTLTDLSECERWRKQVCDEMNEILTRLYSEPLPDAETRYLNDQVNNLIKEVRRWEMRIVELGGIDYSMVGPTTPDGDVLNTRLNQYQYFGRARKLPGVKELLEQEKQRRFEAAGVGKRSSKDTLMKLVDSQYFGLIPTADLSDAEAEAEKKLGAEPFRPDPILEPKFLPSQQSIDSAVSALYSGSKKVAVH